MPRLRCNREQAEAEAIRIAKAFVADSPHSQSYQFSQAYPDNSAPTKPSGKIPAIWSAVFTMNLPGVSVDGGELIVRVNVQEKTAEIRVD